MSWQFWKTQNNVGIIPERMARQLSWRFKLSEETMKGLQHASMAGPTKSLLIRVFDPKLLANGSPVIQQYGDLDSQPSAIQFECSWNPGGSKMENVVDLRPA
ncbi:MAG: hypothetical protein O2821_01415 [Chloroflexi bacterium]|nr:hypothetical protein [Chloroflexota bacterium]MDA1227138.1 hypothetical protein [Chloroflexota bacterium]